MSTLREQMDDDLDIFLNTDDHAESMSMTPHGSATSFPFVGLRSGGQPTAGGNLSLGSSSSERILCRRSVLRAGFATVLGTARDPQPNDRVTMGDQVLTLTTRPELEGEGSDACWISGTIATLDALSAIRRT